MRVKTSGFISATIFLGHGFCARSFVTTIWRFWRSHSARKPSRIYCSNTHELNSNGPKFIFHDIKIGLSKSSQQQRFDLCWRLKCIDWVIRCEVLASTSYLLYTYGPHPGHRLDVYIPNGSSGAATAVRNGGAWIQIFESCYIYSMRRQNVSIEIQRIRHEWCNDRSKLL